MTDLGTWTYEKHPTTGKLIRVRKTRVLYSEPKIIKPEKRAPQPVEQRETRA
jgi:hypothetical protein